MKTLRNVTLAAAFLIIGFGTPVFADPDCTGCASCGTYPNGGSPNITGYWYTACQDSCGFNEAMCDEYCSDYGGGEDNCAEDPMNPPYTLTYGDCVCYGIDGR